MKLADYQKAKAALRVKLAHDPDWLRDALEQLDNSFEIDRQHGWDQDDPANTSSNPAGGKTTMTPLERYNTNMHKLVALHPWESWTQRNERAISESPEDIDRDFAALEAQEKAIAKRQAGADALAAQAAQTRGQKVGNLTEQVMIHQGVSYDQARAQAERIVSGQEMEAVRTNLSSAPSPFADQPTELPVMLSAEDMQKAREAKEADAEKALATSRERTERIAKAKQARADWGVQVQSHIDRGMTIEDARAKVGPEPKIPRVPSAADALAEFSRDATKDWS